ncbi:MAG: S1C family serine protease [Anaerolineales bacterium]|jgi:S1-C subfamily serine protease
MAETLIGLSQELGQAVSGAGKAVLRVEGRRRLPASGFVWSEEGWIITANHVLRRDEGIIVGWEGEETIEAELAGRDPLRDLALLKIPPGVVHEIPFGNLEDIRVGHLVLALGRPGEGVMATLGVISALGSPRTSSIRRASRQYLQTDVVMYPGFSGGPLVSASGVILGMNTSGLMRGASIAIPVGRIERSVKALIEHGRIRQGYLGVSLQPVRISEQHAAEIGQQTGLMVVSVESGGPAGSAGVLQGDVLIKIDGDILTNMDQLFFALGDEQIGQTLKLDVLRAGKPAEMQVRIGERE